LLDAKNGQLESAYRKIGMSMEIMKEINNVELREKETALSILKDITGEKKEDEEKEIASLKEKRAKYDKDLENLKNLVIENAGMIPSNVAQSALMNEDPEQALQSIYPYLGQMQKLDLQLKRLNIASTGLD